MIPRSKFLSLSCLTAACFMALIMPAAATAPGQPKNVILSPAGGRFFIEDTVETATKNGASVISFVIPGNAGGLRMEIPGQDIAHWTTSIFHRNADSALTQTRQTMLTEKDVLTGRLEAAQARVAFWKTIPDQGIPFQDMDERDKRLAEIIAAATSEAAAIRRELGTLDKTISLLPESTQIWQRVTATLQKPVPAAKALAVRYSYTLRNCGWRPVYAFDALPDKDEISVRLLAEIHQFTGLDWRDVTLTLASHEPGMREPAPLPRWEVESRPAPAPARQRELLQMQEFATSAIPEQKPARNAQPAPSPVQADTSGTYASWELTACGLPEGFSRLALDEEVWKTPLQWLARPLGRDSRVWLTANYAPQKKAWPSGSAEYSVDGQYLGQGTFMLEGDSASLFFGVDPRVSVLTTADDKKRGESGFIDKNRIWTWSWSFTLTNAHKRPVNVRLERPAPTVVDQGVTVKQQDSQPAAKDEKNHALFWNVAVPAGGKARLSHSITITAPKDMPLAPAAP